MADTALDHVIGHLGAALAQSCAADDQVIMSHVRDAHVLACQMRKAAPDLLSAAKALITIEDTPTPNMETYKTAFYSALDALRAAVAKAEGTSP